MKKIYILSVLAISLLFISSCGKKKVYGYYPSHYFASDKKVLRLCEAVCASDMDEMKKLVSEGVNINYVGNEGMNPLLWALGAKNKKPFLYLLEKGANPNLQNKDGYSVTEMTAGMEDPQYLKWVLKHGGNPDIVNPQSKETPLSTAITQYCTNNVKTLIESGADLDKKNKIGNYFILYASNLNRYDLVYLLLKGGADHKVKTIIDNTIIDYLKRDLQNPHLIHSGKWLSDKEMVVDILEQKGADVKELRELIAEKKKLKK